MGLKANLRIKLYTDDNFVAEIDNAPLMLWQQLLAHSEGMTTVTPAAQPAPPTILPKAAEAHPLPDNVVVEHAIDQPSQPANTAIQKLASDIEVSEETVISAFDPVDAAPYIALEHKYWEAFRGNVTTKGRKAVSPVAMATTLLALWKFHAKKDFAINAALIGKVLNGASVDAQNIMRSLNNCDWLKVRQDGDVVIIPDNAQKARAIAKAFCTKQPVQNASNT